MKHLCPACNTAYEGNFCPHCGFKWMEGKTCPVCGATVGEDANFCNFCGHSFDMPATDALNGDDSPLETKAGKTPAVTRGHAKKKLLQKLKKRARHSLTSV